MSFEPTVVLTCECGIEFELSARADLDRRKAGREPVCRDCRFPIVVVVTDDMIGWWEERGTTPDDALEMAEALFGSRDCWPSATPRVPPGLEDFTAEVIAAKMSA